MIDANGQEIAFDTRRRLGLMALLERAPPPAGAGELSSRPGALASSCMLVASQSAGGAAGGRLCY
jgi:hypothetical protein